MRFLVKHWPMFGHGGMYFLLGFLPLIAEFLDRYANDEFTAHNTAQCLRYMTLGTIGGLVSLKGFLSTAFSRHVEKLNGSNEKEYRKSNSGSPDAADIERLR